MPVKKKQKRMTAVTDRQARSSSPEIMGGGLSETQEATGSERRLLWRLRSRLQKRARGQLLC